MIVKRIAALAAAYIPIAFLLAWFFDMTLGQALAIGVAVGIYGGACVEIDKRWPL